MGDFGVGVRHPRDEQAGHSPRAKEKRVADYKAGHEICTQATSGPRYHQQGSHSSKMPMVILFASRLQGLVRLLPKQSAVPLNVDETLKDQRLMLQSLIARHSAAVGGAWPDLTCNMCEMVLGAHISHRIDAAIARLQVVIHLHRGCCILALEI